MNSRPCISVLSRPHFLRRSAALTVVLVVSTVLSAAPSPAAATTVKQTFVTMFSDSGDYIGQGQPRFYYPGNGSVTISGTAAYLAVGVSGGTLGDSFGMEFAAPPGEELHSGLYTGAQRAPFREAGRPGIDISGDGRGCNEDGGRFDLKEIRVGSDGSVKRLWLTYEQHCENGVSALFGEVRINVPNSTSGLLVAPGTVWWPDVYVGASGTTVRMTLVDTGSTVMMVTSAQITGLRIGSRPGHRWQRPRMQRSHWQIHRHQHLHRPR